MKSPLLNLVLTGLCCCLAFSLTAQTSNITNDRLIVKVRPCNNTDNIQLWLANMLNLKTTVKLVGEDGNIYYEKNLDDLAAWGEKLELDNFLAGDYYIVVEQHNTVFRKAFHFEKNAVTFANDKAVELAAAVPEL